MSQLRHALFAIVLAGVIAVAGAQAPQGFKFEKLVDGVYAAIRTEAVGLGVDANNLFVIDDEGVVVVDTNFGPSSTRQVLAALRRITDKPVTHVINTHPHDDHVFGTSVYRDAFPDAQVIGHPFLKEHLPGTGATNRKNQVANLPGFAASLKEALAKNTRLTGQPLSDEERAGYQSDLRLIDAYLKDAPSFSDVLPAVTVPDRLTLKRGTRTIEIQHLGRGHTAADLVVHLPAEGIVATGDLVVAPIPLVGADQSYVTKWSSTLDRVIALQPRIILPGHGPVMRDTAYAQSMSDLFASIATQVRAAAAGGQPLATVRKAVDLKAFEVTFAGQSPFKRFLFANYVTGRAVASAYRAVQSPASR